MKDYPIFLQIKEYVIKEILKGKWKCGKKMPSVRELALKLKVNPNTVQKAYSCLEKENVIFVKRGKGYFVNEDENFLKKLREKTIEKYVSQFLKNLKSMGFDDVEIAKILKNYIKKEVNKL